MSHGCLVSSYTKAGQIYEQTLPSQLDLNEAPILIADLFINYEEIKAPQIILKFSEFIEYTLLDSYSQLELTYRLIRVSERAADTQVLNEWTFKFDSKDVSELEIRTATQPITLIYTDNLMCEAYFSSSVEYQIQIISIERTHVKCETVASTSFIATVMDQGDVDDLPYISEGKILNPLLPVKDQPLILSRTSAYYVGDEDQAVMINFSCFVTSALSNKCKGELAFRLVRYDEYGECEVLNTWTFRRAFMSDVVVCEPVVYNYCEHLKGNKISAYVYEMQLVEGNFSENSFYRITQKNMILSSYYDADSKLNFKCNVASIPSYSALKYVKVDEPYKVLGKVLNLKPVELIAIDVNVVSHKVGILVEYSQDLELIFNQMSTNTAINYVLSRYNHNTKETMTLKTWEYKPLSGKEKLETSSLALNYYDDASDLKKGDLVTYKIELISIIPSYLSLTAFNQLLSTLITPLNS